MGANAEGKISLSVELQNFKDIANSLKKGLSQELKQIPLDVKFNNKDLEEQAAAALKDINKMFTETRLKNLDFSSILPAFINEINRGDISDEVRKEVIEGFKAGLTNLKEGGLKQNYAKIKNFSGDDLLRYFLDSNSVEDILGTFNGLSKRQKQGLRSSVLPSLSELKGRGWDAADKEYTKGAKRLEALMQLSGEYGDVMQYGTNPTATKNIIAELDKRFKEGNISKNDAQDIIGYLLRSEFLGIDLGKEISPTDLLKEAENVLGDSASVISERLKERAQAFFTAYDNIFNSTAKKITYTELLDNIENTTNKRFQGLYNTEAPKDLEKVDVGKLFKESVKIKSDEKPELRKRKKDERIKDTTGTKTKSKNKDEEEFKFDDEEDEIQDYDKKINEITEELKKVRDKIDEAKERQQQLKKEIENQQKITDEKTQAYLDYKENYDKYSFSAKKAKQDVGALKETVEGLNERLEEEKQNKEQIESRYNELIAKRESIKKEIEEKEKQLNAILPNAEKQEADIENRINELNNKKTEKEADVKSHEKGIKNQDDWLKWYDIALKNEYKFEGSKAKSEAYEALKSLGKKYLEFRKDPNSSTATDKQAEAARFAVRHYKLWQAAKEAGVAESRLENEKFDTDDDFAYKQAVEYLQQQRGNTEKRREQIKNELDKTKAEIIGIKTEIEQAEAELKLAQEQKRKLLNELRVKPAKKEDDNESNIKREKIKLDSSNSKIQKIEGEKTEAENRLQKVEKYLEKNELTPEREKQHENRLKQLEEESNTQGEILQQKKKDLEREIEETNKLIELGKELIAKQDLLIQKQAEAKKKQEELDKQEEERKKQAKADNKKADDSKDDSETGEPQGSKGSGTTGNTGTSIPPEKLEEILTLLGNIQKALGTLEDGSDIPSITQSVKDMVDALKELSTALGEIKQKDFSLNIGLPNNNPIGQKGEAKRKILKELEQQYNEYMKFYGGKEGLFVSANKYNKQSSEYGNIGEQIVNQFLMPKHFDTSSLVGQIDELQYKLNLLFQFSKVNDFDLSEILSNAKSPSEIIKQINEDVVNANPVTTISKIFKDMKISIDASLAQINTESKGFSFLSGSAEEAAEAKRKFVEANKEVFQSIVASMPKIEEEAEALKKVDDIPQDNIINNAEQDKSSIASAQNITEGIDKQSSEIEEAYLEAASKVEKSRNVYEEAIESIVENNNKKQTQKGNEKLLKEEQARIVKEEQAKIQVQKRAEEEKERIHQKFEEVEQKRQQRKIEQEEKEKEERLQSLRERQERIRQRFAERKNNSKQEENQVLSAEHEQTDSLKQQAKQVEQQAKLAEQAIATHQKINQEVKEYENQFYNWDESGQGQLTFLDKNTNDLTEEYARAVREEAEQAKKKAEEETKKSPTSIEIPIEGQISFTSNEDIDQIIAPFTNEAIQQTEKQFAKLRKSTSYIQSETDVEKFLNPFGDLTLGTDATKFADELINVSDKIRNVKTELESSFDADGKMIGDPERVRTLLKEYDNLIIRVRELKAEISSPLSGENAALNAAKETEKAEKETAKAAKAAKEEAAKAVAEATAEAKKAEAEFDKLKASIGSKINRGFYRNAERNAEGTVAKYGFKDDNNKLISSFLMKDLGFDDSVVMQQQMVETLNSTLEEYKKKRQNLEELKNNPLINIDQLKQASQEVENTRLGIQQLEKDIKATGDKMASTGNINKLSSQIEQFMIKNPRITEDARVQLQAYMNTLNSGATISVQSLNNMQQGFSKVFNEQIRAGNLGTNIWSQMLAKMREGVAFLATKFSFYQIFNQFRQGVNIIHQFDDALTEMMKVSDETRMSLESYQKTTFYTANAIGTSALQLQNSTADFMRLGESLTEAAESAKIANVLMNVSEFQSIDEATKSLIAMGAAYDDLSKMDIIDKLNEVGLKIA